MENKEENFEKIKVFSTDDERLKILGELLTNKSSRDIIKLLADNEMYVNEIAKKLHMRVNLVVYHLKKLRGLGLLEVKNKKIVKKGNEHRYFRMIPNLFITSNHTKEEIKEKGFLKKVFNEGLKLALSAMIGVFSLITSADILLNDKVDFRFSEDEQIWNFTDLAILIPIGIIIPSLIIFLVIKKRR